MLHLQDYSSFWMRLEDYQFSVPYFLPVFMTSEFFHFCGFLIYSYWESAHECPSYANLNVDLQFAFLQALDLAAFQQNYLDLAD